MSNSRPQKRLGRTWRRRSCLVCKAVFTTIEAPLLSEDIIVTHGEHCSAFERDLLFVSLLASLGHRQDAVASAGSLAAVVKFSSGGIHRGLHNRTYYSRNAVLF